MESEMSSGPWLHVAEVELTYKTKIKASDRPLISSSADAAELLKSHWDENKIEFVEQFKVLLLNRANRVLGLVEISSGGVTGTVADPKLVLVAAVKANACAIIMAHNHPSGNLKPSQQDEHLTQKIKAAAQLFDIRLLDHVIITNDGHFSFTEQGLL